MNPKLGSHAADSTLTPEQRPDAMSLVLPIVLAQSRRTGGGIIE